MTNPPRLFISYSQDSEHHKERVGDLADRLVRLGFDCLLDQYEIAPPQGWLRWMEDQIAAADFVLVVATEGYLRKVEGPFKGGGLGARYEADKILADLYHKGGINERFIAVCFADADRAFIHPTLKVYTYHVIADAAGFAGLKRHLEKRPPRLKPKIGEADSAPAPAATIAPGTRRVHDKTGIELVWVPPGRYRQGGETHDWEKPIHAVELSGFWIGRFPVTNEQYWPFLIATSGRQPEWIATKDFGADDQPVVGVDWMEAMAFCRWAGLGLPSEAQWEAGARGKDLREYPWGNESPTAEYANFESKVGHSSAVGVYSKGAGPFGTLDQAGNVWELCRDDWDEKTYLSRSLKDPCREGSPDAGRVVRGGSWALRAWDLRAASRGRGGPSFRSRFLGFRVVLVSAPEP